MTPDVPAKRQAGASTLVRMEATELVRQASQPGITFVMAFETLHGQGTVAR